MIEIPTLFILGAGASVPYGYPTGYGLRKDIIENCLHDFDRLPDIQPSKELSAIVKHNRAGLEKFINNFDGSYLKSIDKYLSLNPSDVESGKFAITLSILKKERSSRFREQVNPKEDWWGYLFNHMTSTFKNPDDYKHFCENQVAFITFNYDRSLEYCLYDSFHYSFQQRRKEIADRIESCVPFPIIHVYGCVSPLSLTDWYDGAEDYKSDLFNSFKIIQKKSPNINVIGEERSGASVKDQVKELLQTFKKIFFLGFSFDKDNLDAIDLPKNINQDWTMYGAAKEMTERERNEARSRLNEHFRDKAVANMLINPIIKDTDSCALLREFL